MDPQIASAQFKHLQNEVFLARTAAEASRIGPFSSQLSNILDRERERSSQSDGQQHRYLSELRSRR